MFWLFNVVVASFAVINNFNIIFTIWLCLCIN